MNEQKTDMEKLLKELGEAKKNVLYLLDNPDGLVDMHGLAYWAGVVEQLRIKIKKSL